MPPISRRAMIGGASASCAEVALALPAIAQDTSLKIGLMLPFSGVYAALGEAIAAGFDMHVRELDGKIGGRQVELLRVDDESDPTKAQSNVNRLLGRARADVLVGSVQSDVAMTLARAARDQQVPLIIPHAGNDALTREKCWNRRVSVVVQQLATGIRHGSGAGCQRAQKSRLAFLGSHARDRGRRWIC